MGLNLDKLHESLEGTIESAMSAWNSGQPQTQMTLRETADKGYMIDGVVRVDAGEKVRLYLPPSNNPLQLLALEVLDEAGGIKFAYATSCLYLK
ncbi:MAG: hypothetical protein HGA85_06180 [Nanoarchaeota archaeon]|nr:hypothetical protein [Nanoarchaeota archaeon]